MHMLSTVFFYAHWVLNLISLPNLINKRPGFQASTRRRKAQVPAHKAISYFQFPEIFTSTFSYSFPLKHNPTIISFASSTNDTLNAIISGIAEHSNFT